MTIKEVRQLKNAEVGHLFPLCFGNMVGERFRLLQMDKSDLQEQLLRLYLRLNGFFTSGFIVHARESTKNKTEIDTLAVRFPHSREPQRQTGPDPWLELSNQYVELAICEAKAKKIRFNKALYGDTKQIEAILRWAGMFSQYDVTKLAPQVQAILIPESNPSPIIRRTQPHKGVVIRSLLFCPERQCPSKNESFFVGSEVIFPFIFKCLSPRFEPPMCGRRYGAGQWAELADLVGFFKKWPSQEPPEYKDLEKAVHKETPSFNHS